MRVLVTGGLGFLVTREFTHVADVANAISLALSRTDIGNSRTYNVGSGTETTMLQVIHTVGEVTGRPVVVEHLPPKPEPKILMSDSSRIRAALSWLPQQSGLADMIRDGWQSMRDMTTLP